jgi:Tfp pilus assembly protein PilO
MKAIFQQLLAFARERPFVAGALAFALVFGASNYFFWQLRRETAQKHDEVRRKGELMLRALANRSRIDADLAALRTAIAYIEKHLLEEQSMEVNLGYFYKLEKPARVRLVRLNQLAPPPTVDKKSFKAVPFSMKVTGTYRNTMNFIRALETGSRLVRIRTCSFERSATDNNEFTLDLTVDALARL